MKKFDYIVIQAPMISELGLKGNSLLVFALIHSYTRDGKHTFRASLKDMAEWFTTSQSAISSTLNALVESAYINKVGPDEAPEYTTNFEALMVKVEAEGALKTRRVYKPTAKKKAALLNQKGLQNGVESSTTESVGVLNQYGKPTESVGGKTTDSVALPINRYINIYKYSCSYGELTEAQKQEEQKQIFKLFFFKGAADPAAEVTRFIGHNQANGWQNNSGTKKYDTTEKRLGLADLWKFQLGEREKAKTFLKVWREIYEKVEALEGADVLLDPRISFGYTDTIMTINCTLAAARFIESHISEVKAIFVAHAAGKKIQYKYI